MTTTSDLWQPTDTYDETAGLNLSPYWALLAGLVSRFRADVVVLIARRTPKLAEFLKLHFGDRCIIISDLAIPTSAMYLRGARVAVVDDVLNVGSTVVQAAQAVRSCNPREIEVFAIGARRPTDNLEGFPVRLVIATALSATEYMAIVASVPEILARLSKPYDLEFPVFRCRFGLSFTRSNQLLSWLQSRPNLGITSDVTPAEAPDHLHRLTIDLPPLKGLNRKIRLYVDERNQLCHFVPFEIASPIEYSQIRHPYARRFATELTRMVGDYPEGACVWHGDVRRRIQLFSSSLSFGLEILADFSEILAVDEEVPLVLEDAELLFGPIVVDALKAANETESTDEKCSTTSPDIEEGGDTPFLSHLRLSGDRSFLDLVRSRCQSSEKPWLIFEAIFRTLADAVGSRDIDAYSLEEPLSVNDVRSRPYLRLRIGPTFGDLVKILLELGCARDALHARNIVSVFLDVFIDSGVIVPSVGHYGGHFYRIYRKGESEPRDIAVAYTLNAWNDYGKPLSRTRFTKICATLSFAEGLAGVTKPSALERGNVAAYEGTILDDGVQEVSDFLRGARQIKRA